MGNRWAHPGCGRYAERETGVAREGAALASHGTDAREEFLT
jgi:hypothetical protein